MKVKENITIYKCDFCKKELKRRYAMERHEERCYNNPANDRPCLHCPHLERKEILFDTGIIGYYDGEPVMRGAKTFYCAAKSILLLHPKTKYLTGSGNLAFVWLDDKETEQFDMPTQCDIFRTHQTEESAFINSL
jgi:hypothetical protein